MKEKQINKQLKFAINLLNKIREEISNGSVAYGSFAIEIQREEVNRLSRLLNNKKYMKTISLLFCLLLLGCKQSLDKEIEKDVRQMFESLECPINSQPYSSSN